jgi:hypothetical protein
LIGNANNHCEEVSSASRAKLEAFALAISASREIDILFGIPVDPDVSKINAVSSATVSGNSAISGLIPFTSGPEINKADLPSSTSAKAISAAKVSLAGTILSALVIKNI